MIRGDERKGKQSSWTLLSNALKFMPDGGRIDVGARLRDGAAEVSLGQSLADQIMKEVFQPQTALPSPSNSVEWLLARTFSTTIYVPQLFSELGPKPSTAGVNHGSGQHAPFAQGVRDRRHEPRGRARGRPRRGREEGRGGAERADEGSDCARRTAVRAGGEALAPPPLVM